MRVYRVERERDGAGPYPTLVREGGYAETAARHGDRFGCYVYDHPGPGSRGEWDTDLYRNWKVGHRFGFTSLRAARKWWYRQAYREWLDRNGFCLSVYEVPRADVLRGNTQCAFRKDGARLLHQWPVASLIKH